MKFSATSKQSKGTVQDQMHIVPYDQNGYPMNQIQKFTQQHIGKIGLFHKSTKKSQIFIKTDQILNTKKCAALCITRKSTHFEHLL